MPLPSAPTKAAVAVTTQKEPENPKMKFDSMSAYGVLRYSFDQAMRVPANLTTIDSAVLDVTIQPQAGSDLNNFNFTWNVTDYKPTFVELQLYF